MAAPKLPPKMPAGTGDNPGWTPDIARMLVEELHKNHHVQVQLLDVLRDLRDELALLRERRERERRERTDRRQRA